jgi:hypothetical protein
LTEKQGKRKERDVEEFFSIESEKNGNIKSLGEPKSKKTGTVFESIQSQEWPDRSVDS